MNSTFCCLRLDEDKGYISNNLLLPKTKINVAPIKSALTFQPAGRSENNKERFAFKENSTHLVVPRNFCAPSDVDFPIFDIRPKHFPRINIQSNIILDFINPSETTQKDALNALLNNQGGVLQLACGLGKTVVALECIRRLEVPALIVVENMFLMRQWEAEIQKFLTLDEPIGKMCAGVVNWKRPIVLATYISLAKQAASLSEEMKRHFGVVFWDEGHHVAAETYSLTADMFYGRRFALTATPERTDGMHILHKLHMGPIVYKNLKQTLSIDIEFRHSGYTPDFEDVEIQKDILSKNKETHLMKLAGHFAKVESRLQLTTDLIKGWRAEGRKILVLSFSVAELVNLYCRWVGKKERYTDIKFSDIDLTVPPKELSKDEYAQFKRRLRQIESLIENKIDAVSLSGRILERDMLKGKLDGHEAFRTIQLEMKKRQKQFIKDAVKTPGAGLIIGSVPTDERQSMIKTFPVIFSIMDYGVEGLDEPGIDTVLALEAPSQEGAIRQMMGRALRYRPLKKSPLICFIEDGVDISAGICANIRRLLRQWPTDLGGPLSYKMTGYPKRGNK